MEGLEGTLDPDVVAGRILLEVEEDPDIVAGSGRGSGRNFWKWKRKRTLLEDDSDAVAGSELYVTERGSDVAGRGSEREVVAGSRKDVDRKGMWLLEDNSDEVDGRV